MAQEVGGAGEKPLSLTSLFLQGHFISLLGFANQVEQKSIFLNAKRQGGIGQLVGVE